VEDSFHADLQLVFPRGARGTDVEDRLVGNSVAPMDLFGNFGGSVSGSGGLVADLTVPRHPRETPARSR
jgi:hypothetical protein